MKKTIKWKRKRNRWEKRITERWKGDEDRKKYERSEKKGKWKKNKKIHL